MFRSSGFPILTKQSYNYETEIVDTVHNYASTSYTITSPSGSAAENITPDESLNVIAVDWQKIVYQSLVPNFTLAVVFTLIILAAFYLTVYTMIRQKKLSDIKNDFINNMTHEFKTPIATISLAVDALKNEKVQSNKEKMAYFSGIIKEENQRMNKQVETILKASQFEKQEVELDKIYTAKVVKVEDFGAFVQLWPGCEGLVHVSQLANERVEKASDVVKVGDEILVKSQGYDKRGRLNLSRKDAIK